MKRMLWIIATMLMLSSLSKGTVAGSLDAPEILHEYRHCVETKRAAFRKTYWKDAYSDKGCYADQVGWDNKRHWCHEDVCWDAPPNHIIVDAEVWSHSASGSPADYGEIRYLPTREAATRICNTVRARSERPRYSGRAWQKLSAKVSLQSQLTEEDLRKISADCEQKVLYQTGEAKDD